MTSGRLGMDILCLGIVQGASESRSVVEGMYVTLAWSLGYRCSVAR